MRFPYWTMKTVTWKWICSWGFQKKDSGFPGMQRSDFLRLNLKSAHLYWTSPSNRLPSIFVIWVRGINMRGESTICALATSGSGAIAVIRISGPDTYRIVQEIFQAASEGKILEGQAPNTIHYGNILDQDNYLLNHWQMQ